MSKLYNIGYLLFRSLSKTRSFQPHIAPITLLFIFSTPLCQTFIFVFLLTRASALALGPGILLALIMVYYVLEALLLEKLSSTTFTDELAPCLLLPSFLIDFLFLVLQKMNFFNFIFHSQTPLLTQLYLATSTTTTPLG